MADMQEGQSNDEEAKQLAIDNLRTILSQRPENEDDIFEWEMKRSSAMDTAKSKGVKQLKIVTLVLESLDKDEARQHILEIGGSHSGHAGLTTIEYTGLVKRFAPKDKE